MVTIVALEEGPQGPAAGQDVGWGALSGLFAAGEVLDTPPLGHAATYNTLIIHTRSGVAQAQTVAISQVTNEAATEVASFTLDPGDHDVEVSIAPVSGARRDVFRMVMPTPADIQLSDLSVTLGSIP